MRFSTILFTLSAIASASASVYPRQSLPSCADSCIENADLGSCGASDNACLCKSSSFINSTTTCIESSCSGSDLTNAIAYSQALCAAVGITLTSTPVAASTSASATSPASSATGSASSSSSASSTSSASTSSSTGAALSTRANVGLGALAFLGAVFAL